MKAYQLCAVNDLRYEECEEPIIKDGWCLVEIKAAGICSSDIPRIYSKGTYHFPTIPGHEFSGIVKSVKSEKDKHWLNKRVGIFPLIPCKKCEQCNQHHYEMCLDYDYLGSRRDGGFAEYVAVPIWNLIELPESLSFEVGAMLEPLAVAVHAIKKSGVVRGNKVAILGTGMIGFSIAWFAKIYGALDVDVIGRSDSKKKIAETLGVHYISTENEKIEKTYDVVFEAVGSNQSINSSINIARPGATLVLLGNPEGEIRMDQDIYWKILRKQLVLKGTWNSSYENNSSCDWSEVIGIIAENQAGAKAMLTHIYPQEELKKGLELMKEHKTSYCKVMTIWNRG